jgi:ABC-type transport system involved in cytochrome c biogenesis permease subunit
MIKIKIFLFVLFYCLCSSFHVYSIAKDNIPIGYQGRFRPLKAYALLHSSTSEQLWKRSFKKNSSAPSAYQARYEVLKLELRPPKEIAQILEQEFPLSFRLKLAGDLTVIPTKNGDWTAPYALGMRVYDELSNDLVPLLNFTPYSDETFDLLRKYYQEEDSASFIQTLLLSYDTLSGTPYQKAHKKNLVYPSRRQLKAENFYISYPWVSFLIILYGLSVFLFILRLNRIAFTALIIAFLIHTFVLLIRCYILNRPPVSNMYETALYVPWIAIVAGFILNRVVGYRSPIIASSISATIILGVLKLSGLEDSLNNVQAVLDSQFWLIIHVLMVVGSYGLFMLAGVLGHFYIISRLFTSQSKGEGNIISSLNLQSLYAGTALLIGGTILGGVWAAESWGRFWDWDPKEAWAFISSCLYLLFIHAYRFRKIGNFGLAIGSILGLLAISFTWYGVNYILGTGLHSYGFGSGGEIFYYLFVGFESLFLIIALIFYPRKRQENHTESPR